MLRNRFVVDRSGSHVLGRRRRLPLLNITPRERHELIKIESLNHASFLQSVDRRSGPVLGRPVQRPLFLIGPQPGTQQFLDLDDRRVLRVADVNLANEMRLFDRVGVAGVTRPRRAAVVPTDEEEDWLRVGVVEAEPTVSVRLD